MHFLLAVAFLLAVFANASSAIAAGDASEAERHCRDWADSLFAKPTAAKARETVNCIAARDPYSAEAHANRRAAEIEQAARAERERIAEAERLRGDERDNAEAMTRCGDALIPALGPLAFCDSPEAVKRRASRSDGSECATSDACTRLKWTAATVPLTAYPKYLDSGLHHIDVYAPERSRDEFNTTLRGDWERMVSLAEAEHGPATDSPTPFPPFFAVDGVHVTTTHYWTLGRKRVRVGVFEGGDIYRAIMTVEDGRVEARKSHYPVLWIQQTMIEPNE